MATKRKKPIKVFDDDGVVVEQTFTDDSVDVFEEKENTPFDVENVDVSVYDVIDTFAGYMIPKFGVNKSEDGAGVCIFCNGKTQYAKRKICVSCLEKYGVTNILDKVQEAAAYGRTYFTFDMNNE